jgi:hypothetical protein
VINQIGENENSLTLDAWLLSQKWENENSLTLDAWLLSQKWENEISLTLDAWLLSQKWENENSFNPRFLRSQKIGYFGILYQWKCEEMVMVNCNNEHHFSLNQNNNNPMCVCVCVCVCVFVFWDSSIVSKGLNNIFFILLNFPPPPRNKAWLLGTSWVAWENR